MDIAQLVLEYIRVLVWPVLIVGGALAIYRHFGVEFRGMVKRLTQGSEYELRAGGMTISAKVNQAVMEAVERNAASVGSEDPEKLRRFVADAAARIIQLLGISNREMLLLQRLHLIPLEAGHLRKELGIEIREFEGLVRGLQAKGLIEVKGDDPSRRLTLTKSGVLLVSKHKLYSGVVDPRAVEDVAYDYEIELEGYYADMADSLGTDMMLGK